MKAAGFMLLPSGWLIVVSALVLLSETKAGARAGFVLAGVLVEALGLFLVVRAHILRRGHRG